MRVSYRWLKDYTTLTEPAATLAEKLTFAGLELDEIISRCENLDQVVVAKVLTCEPVEGSDHLHLLSVDAGEEQPLSIICGAPNIRAGQIVPCAKVGAVLPGDFVISARKTFGHLSQGMICSQKELGYSEEHSGIWELDPYFPEGKAPIGQLLTEALDLTDQVMDIELTPNRSDCLGMINMAREAAAVSGGKVAFPDLTYAEEGGQAQDEISITVQDESLCPRYVGRLVKDVKIGPSPLWMQNYLLAAGMRPINNVVDISNFVMLEMNQPLHTFDYQQLKGKQIIVRASQPGEQMQTLDGKDHTFTGEEILICDAERPICIAGVMGGMDTEVTEATTDILIEAACFEPVHIRRTARRMGIPSEASMRFEKGVDVASCDLACRRAAQLLVKYCGGVAAKGAVDVRAKAYQDGFPGRQVMLKYDRVNEILGTAYTPEEIQGVMDALGFPCQEMRDHLLVSVPSYRQDISLDVDLIEEVARIKGYDRIPATIPVNATIGGRTEQQALLLKLRDICVALGLNETINYSFISPKDAEKLHLAKDHPWQNSLPISNPLSEEQSVMRQTLLPGLLRAAARNQSRRNLDLRFFEVGNIFIPAEENMTTVQPTEMLTLGMLMLGKPEDTWNTKGKEYDFYDMKGVVEAMAAALGLPQLSFSRTEEDYLHPGRTAEIQLNGIRLGVIGEIHPHVAASYEISGRAIVAELAVTPLIMAALGRGNTNHDLPKYPSSTRDIAVIGSTDIAASVIEQTIREAGGEYLRNIQLFDLYDKAPIPAGKRSLAYSLTFRDEEGTLTDEKVDAAFAAIVEALASRYDYCLR